MTGISGSVLILGGLSDIGRATAMAFAAKGNRVQLAGRDMSLLQREAADMAIRTRQSVSVHEFDVLKTETFDHFIDSLPALPDVVICVIGILGDQATAEVDSACAARIMRTNFEGPALILDAFAERFLARGSGCIVGVSSVAGDRGRASNYVYGSAKAGFTAFLSGLRNRCATKGVHVATVKPGFVRTRMTEGMKLPAFLTAEPSQVGEAIARAVSAKRNVIYTLSIWRVIMAIVCAIPDGVFKKLKL